MNIAITGASGFIGRHLTAFFTEQGHRVVPLGRPMFREGMLGYLVQALSHCDVIINLAGAPVKSDGRRNINMSYMIAVYG